MAKENWNTSYCQVLLIDSIEFKLITKVIFWEAFQA
jgi:hypothetical protein